MKKWMSVLLTCLLALSLGIVGCGKEEPAPTTDEEQPATETVSESDFDYLNEKGKVTIGITLFSPMNFYEGSELVGFDTELAKAVFAELGLTPEFIEINWDSKEIELNSKNVDCLWNGMCITEERRANMGLTDPYLNNTQAMVMKAEREDEILAGVAGLNAVAEQGSTGEGKLLGTIPDDESVVVSAKEYFADVNYIPVDSMAKALMEVKSGTADLALVDSVCALGMVTEASDYSDLVVNLDNNFGAQQYGIAFRKDSDMPEKVNEVLAALTADGTVGEIAAKYGLSEMLINK